MTTLTRAFDKLLEKNRVTRKRPPRKPRRSHGEKWEASMAQMRERMAKAAANV